MAESLRAPRDADRRSSLRLYFRLVAAKTRADWQYRLSFVLFLISQAIVALLDFAVLLVIFGQVQELAGWTRPQVLLLYALSGIAFGLADLFISQVELAAVHIKQGTFDQFLLRPVGALWQLSAREFAPRRVGRLLQPLAVMVVVTRTLDVAWTAPKIALVPVTIVCATIIFGSIWVATSSIAFWTVDTQEFANSFTYGGNFLTQYPLEILGTWLRRFVTYVVPLAFVCYFPTAYIVDRPDPAGSPVWFAFAGPPIAVITAVIARCMWTQGIRHYRSTGS